MSFVNATRVLVVAVFLVLISQPCYATTIHVPADQPTIQDGLSAAQNNDTILIAPGTYSGDSNRDLTTGGKVLTVLGDGEVVIDCAGVEPHVGFSIRQQADTILIENLSVINAADSIGAVRIDFGDAHLRNCRIYNNQTDGVRVTRQGRVTLDSCLVYDNSGRGIYVGDMVVPWGSLNARWSTIAGNGEDGIYLKAFETGTIENCTVAKNGLAGILSEGDPPKNADFMDMIVDRCLIWENGDVGIGRIFISGLSTLTCNNSFGNGGLGDFYNLPDSAGDVNGNISEDPIVVNATPWPGFELRHDSPCLPANNSCGVLIGSWGEGSFACECWTGTTGDVNRNGESNLTDLTLMINNLFVTFAPLPCPPTANINGDSACDINLTDLTALVNHLFVTFDPTADLSEFDNCLCY